MLERDSFEATTGDNACIAYRCSLARLASGNLILKTLNSTFSFVFVFGQAKQISVMEIVSLWPKMKKYSFGRSLPSILSLRFPRSATQGDWVAPLLRSSTVQRRSVAVVGPSFWYKLSDNLLHEILRKF